MTNEKRKGYITIGLFISCLLAVNILPVWGEEWAEVLFLLVMLGYAVFIGLFFVWAYHFIFMLFEKFSNRNRNIIVTIMTFCIGAIYLFPFGISHYFIEEDVSIFIAQREGAANCRTIFKLFSDNRFEEKNICFGSHLVKGEFYFKNDTIHFTDINYGRGQQEYFQFATIQKSKYSERPALVRHKNIADVIGNELWIERNNLVKAEQQ